MPKSDTNCGVEATPEQRAEDERERAPKKLERSNAAKVMRRFANKVKPLGFTRKSTWFARESDLVVQFMYIHKYSFGPYFRLHYGIRVLNDMRTVVALNGPTESQDLEFGVDDDSLEDCAEAMFSLVTTRVESWFENQTVDILLEADSCLYPHERDALRTAMEGKMDNEAVGRSRELLGLN